HAVLVGRDEVRLAVAVEVAGLLRFLAVRVSGDGVERAVLVGVELALHDHVALVGGDVVGLAVAVLVLLDADLLPVLVADRHVEPAVAIVAVQLDGLVAVGAELGADVDLAVAVGVGLDLGGLAAGVGDPLVDAPVAVGVVLGAGALAVLVVGDRLGLAVAVLV